MTSPDQLVITLDQLCTLSGCCHGNLYFLQVRLESFELFLELSISVQANESTCSFLGSIATISFVLNF